jgi:serralysin
VTDEAHRATLNFHGTYSLANFKFADDGNGGTVVYDPPVPGLPPTGQGANVSVDLSNDAFVFHPNLGLSASELQPQTAPDHNEHPEFAATYSAVHDAHENIIGDFAHDAIALHNATLVQLHQAHFLV